MIDTKIIWMMVKISSLFCQPHCPNSFMVLQSTNIATIIYIQTMKSSKTKGSYFPNLDSSFIMQDEVNMPTQENCRGQRYWR